jgi:beta-fructofuranosidase
MSRNHALRGASARRAGLALAIAALGPVLLAGPGAADDPWRPAYHFTPPMGWMNDPNGLVQVGGTYHLFYQFHPFGVDWGPMHWGHAVSADLVRWAHQPIALAPTPGGPDAGGCFSGSAVDDGGVLSLVYTGHGPAQVQCLATSADGRTFTKHSGNPVIASPPPEFAPADFRDPKVWRAGDRWWLVAGTKRDGKGQALLYESGDLRTWAFRAVMAESDGSQGAMWECPDVFALGGRHLLIVSPNEGVDRPKVFAITGILDYATGRFTQESHRLVDHGFDFYAPQTFQDAGGRRVLIGWMENWARKTWPTKAHGWAGAMTVPRIVALRDDGVPTYTPVPELQALRRDPVRVPSRDIRAGLWPVPEVEGDALEIAVELQPATAAAVGLAVRRSKDGRQETRIVYDARARTLAIDRERAGEGDRGVHMAPLVLAAGESLRLRVFVDRSSVEVFAQDGAVTLTERVFPEASSRGVALLAEGGRARLVSLEAWRLADAR